MQTTKKQIGKWLIMAVLMGLSLAILTACTVKMVPMHQTYESEFLAMGTIITQKVTGANAPAAMEEVIEKIKTLEKLMTFKEPVGDVYKLNENAGRKNVELDRATIEIIKKAIVVAELSEGAYDITVGPLVQLWAREAPKKNVPTKEELQKLLPLVNYKDIYIDEHSGGLKRAGQMIDLGGIAKGYAGDVAIQIYIKHGINSGFINIGGNVTTLGSKPDGSLWKIGIRNPRPKGNMDQGEQILGYINIKDKAVSTAGDDQRYFEKEGHHYHHILNPANGYPAETDLISVTLVADSSLEADAFDTAVFIMGYDKGMELIRNYGGVEAIFVTKDKKIYVTEGLKDNFIFIDESNQFQYVDNTSRLGN